MEGDEWVIYNFVLKPTQVVVKRDDVFFKRDSTCKRDPAFISFNFGAGDGKPLMKFFRLANKGPNFFGAAIDEVAATNRSHIEKLTCGVQ